MKERKKAPSADAWLEEAKADPQAGNCGMYLMHSGVVRKTARAQVRMNQDSRPVIGLRFSFDAGQVAAAIEHAKQLPGIHYVRVWLNEGELAVGEKIMQVLVGGDIRPHVIDALDQLVDELKKNCVSEEELYQQG